MRSSRSSRSSNNHVPVTVKTHTSPLFRFLKVPFMRQRGTPNSRKTYPTPKHLANPFHTLSTFRHIRFCPHIYLPCPSSCILKSFGRQLAHTRPPVLCPIVGLSLFNRVVTNAPIFLIRYTPSTTCSSSPAALLYINVPSSAVLCSQSCRSARFSSAVINGVAAICNYPPP